VNRVLDALVRATRQQLKGIADNLLVVIGAVVTFGSFLALVYAKPVRSWVAKHPIQIYSALIVTLFALLLALNYARDLKNRYDALANAAGDAERPQPTSHDSALLRELLASMPPDGKIMEWLKQDFDSLQLPSERVSSLSQAGRKLTLDPVGFDNRSADGGYRELGAAIEAFCQKVREWAYADARDTYLEVPPEWQFEYRERYQTAIADIQQARQRVIEAYDGFLHTCHIAGIDA
jgi:hypothetical protein